MQQKKLSAVFTFQHLKKNAKYSERIEKCESFWYIRTSYSAIYKNRPKNYSSRQKMHSALSSK